jgi:hypothetical protein
MAIKTKNPAKGGFNPNYFGEYVYIALIIIVNLKLLSRIRNNCPRRDIE